MNRRDFFARLAAVAVLPFWTRRVTAATVANPIPIIYGELSVGPIPMEVVGVEWIEGQAWDVWRPTNSGDYGRWLEVSHEELPSGALTQLRSEDPTATATPPNRRR